MEEQYKQKYRKAKARIHELETELVKKDSVIEQLKNEIMILKGGGGGGEVVGIKRKRVTISKFIKVKAERVYKECEFCGKTDHARALCSNRCTICKFDMHARNECLLDHLRYHMVCEDDHDDACPIELYVKTVLL
jgi:hypothetical protein